MDSAVPKEPVAPLDVTGRTLGDYRVLRRLGQGGMGYVYLAEQISLRRRVALKILRADAAADPKYLQRFKAEAEAIARATHANIVQVYAIGEVDGLHFMALEYVEGRNLREVLLRRGTPELGLVLSLMRQVAAALERAAELGIIHRDIKPDNILLTRKGEVKVADFGLARVNSDQPLNLTQSGITMGTPLYMSPEQVQGQPVDVRSDIYSFGVTCYHMLSGQPPFKGDNAFQVALKHINEQPEPLCAVRPDLPAELCGIVDKMMAKKPEARYQTPRDLLTDLARVRQDIDTATGIEPIRAAVLALPSMTGQIALDRPPPSTITLTVPRWSRWTWLALLSLPLWLLLGLGAAFAFLHLRPSTAAAPPVSSGGNTGGDQELEADRLLVAQADARLEQYYREGVEKNPHPSNLNELVEAMHFCCELAVFYLERGKLRDADEFFARLVSEHSADAPRPFDPERALHYLGRLGQAMVLAFRDDVDSSQREFRALLPSDKPDRLDTMLQKHPRFAELLALALERNRQSLGVKELTEPMEKYRKPKR